MLADLVATLATVAQLGVESRAMVLGSRHRQRARRRTRDNGYQKITWARHALEHDAIRIYVFYVVQLVFQHQAMAAIGSGKRTLASCRNRSARGATSGIALSIKSPFSFSIR